MVNLAIFKLLNTCRHCEGFSPEAISEMLRDCFAIARNDAFL